VNRKRSAETALLTVGGPKRLHPIPLGHRLQMLAHHQPRSLIAAAPVRQAEVVAAGEQEPRPPLRPLEGRQHRLQLRAVVWLHASQRRARRGLLQDALQVVGAKPPLQPKHVWAIRTQLQLAGRVRDLALFNLASAANCAAVITSRSWSATSHPTATGRNAPPSG
jgi:hypothetical protein